MAAHLTFLLFVSAIFFGNDYATWPCFCLSLLSIVITGALNFELLPNICCAIYTIKYICHLKFVRVVEALFMMTKPC